MTHGGFGYDCDACNDELPSWVTVEGRSLLVVPYSLATNDAKLVDVWICRRGDIAPHWRRLVTPPEVPA